MNDAIVIAGNNEFNQKVEERLNTNNFETKHLRMDALPAIDSFSQPIEQAKVVFIHSEPNLLPVAQFALRKAKHVVLFGVEKCSLQELEILLNLAIESNSYLVNGDSLLFNPVVYPMIDSFKLTEITSLTSNRFRKYLSRRQIFNCIEFLLCSNQSGLKNIFAKGVKLNGERLNVLHARFEFEDDSLAVLELTNSKEEPKLYVESAGKGNWMSLDLLTFNGQYYHYSDEEEAEVKPPKQIFPKEQNSLNHLLNFLEFTLAKQINPHFQFENAIQTARAIQQIEDQLRRGLPNFVHFEK